MEACFEINSHARSIKYFYFSDMLTSVCKYALFTSQAPNSDGPFPSTNRHVECRCMLRGFPAVDNFTNTHTKQSPPQ
jgi:hypothetical protein